MSHVFNSIDCEQTTLGSQALHSGSIFKKIQTLLSYLAARHPTRTKGLEENGKPILRLLEDVVSALPTTPTGLLLNADKTAKDQTVSDIWKSYDCEPILVVLSDVKSSNNVKRVDLQDVAKDCPSESDSTLKNQPRELKVYSIKSHPRRLCLDLAFASGSPANPGVNPPAKTSKATKKKRRSRVTKRTSVNAKEKEEGLTVRQCEDGSYITTTVSATGLGRHTRWHYDS